MRRRSFLGSLASCLVALPALARGPRTVALANVWTRLRQSFEPLYQVEHLRQHFLELARKHDLRRGEADFRRFVRLRTLFEATRDGGLWHLRWTITDQEPTSKRIWRQWQGAKPDVRVTALAECDELSALLGFLCSRLEAEGNSEVGLFWPRKDHTVAVWLPPTNTGRQARIVVPTSQIFLPESATLDTAHWDPHSQKTIYPYRGQDAPDDARLPQWLVRFFVSQIADYGAATTPLMSRLRTERVAWLTDRPLSPDLRSLAGLDSLDRQALDRFLLRYERR